MKPILQYPNFNEQFILTIDASKVDVGSVLSQFKNGADLPVAYFSRTLNNNNKFKRKFLAIFTWKKFIIHTDHRPLQWLFNFQNPSSKLVRYHKKK